MTKLSESYGLLQAANKGGPGTSKNMIGTRGENKVIVLKLLHSCKIVHMDHNWPLN